MTVPIYAVAFVISVITGISADRTRMKAVHTFGACVLGVISFVICVTVSNNTVRCVDFTGHFVFETWCLQLTPLTAMSSSVLVARGFGPLRPSSSVG